ncbi:MAG: type I phosphomannose isomerase catalytic subunit [Spirochaetota bacterium]
MFYPFKFKPILKEKIWGGNALAGDYGKAFDPSMKIGESWEVSTVPEDESMVSNGQLAGESLEDLIVEYKELIVGERVFKEHKYEFPLLIKFLDATEKLSVQVHPANKYARAHGQRFGKTEMWFILSAAEHAKLIVGLKPGTTKDELVQALGDKTITTVLNYLPVKAGDVIYLPAGRVHAILEGIVLAEIQQTSDLTYRLYDWDRVDDAGHLRELHIPESLENINFNDTEPVMLAKTFSAQTGFETASVIANDYFSVEEIHNSGVRSKYEAITAMKESFEILMAVGGEGNILHPKGMEPFAKGETLLLPAALGEYTVKGRIDFLRIRA